MARKHEASGRSDVRQDATDNQQGRADCVVGEYPASGIRKPLNSHVVELGFS